MNARQEQPLKTLFLHELKRRRENGRKGINAQWRLVYFFSFIVIAMILTIYFNLIYHVQLKYIWNICWGIPWMIFGLSISLIHREWRNETVGWWLTFPYPRSTLVVAKFWAMLVRGVSLACSILLLIIVFGAFATLVSSTLSFGDFLAFIKSGLIPILLDLAALPLAVGAGLILGTLGRTKFRPAMPLFWIIWGLSWGLSGSAGWFEPLSQFKIPIELVAAIIGSWLLTWILILLASWLLEKKLDL